MFLRPFFTLLRQKQLGAMVASNSLYKPFYRLSYLAALKASGLMDRLRDQTIPLEELAKACTSDTDAKCMEALSAWLQMGCRLRLLRHDRDGYALRGLAKTLARPENDAALALSQEVASLHHQLIMETPGKLRAGALWTLDNQDGELTTRSSRALEAFELEALRRFIPRAGACHLLEIGCGSGIYIRHATDLNPRLTALGIELQLPRRRAGSAACHGENLPEAVWIAASDDLLPGRQSRHGSPESLGCIQRRRRSTTPYGRDDRAAGMIGRPDRAIS